MQKPAEFPGATSPSTLERNREILRRVIEDALGRGDVQALDDIMAPDVREHQRGNPSGREGTKGVFRGLRRAFPDFRVQIRFLDAAEDRAWVLFRASGTHTGPFFGIPPTGKPMEIDVMDVVRIQDGRIVEHWGVPDQLGMLEQVGLVPERP